MSNKIIFNITFILITFFIIDYTSNYYYSNFISEYFNESLINLGLKEKPKIQEGFPGPFDPIIMANGIISMTNSILGVVFRSLIAVFIIKFARGITEVIWGGTLATIFGAQHIALGIPDLFVFLAYIIRWIIDHVICLITGIFNFPTCVFFYIMNLIGQLFYLPFRAFFYIIDWGTDIDIYKMEKEAWDKIYEADEWFFKNIAPFHFADWPISIRDKCFSCVRMKMSAVGNKFVPVSNRGKKLSKAVAPHVRVLSRGFMRILDSMQSIFG